MLFDGYLRSPNGLWYMELSSGRLPPVSKSEMQGLRRTVIPVTVVLIVPTSTQFVMSTNMMVIMLKYNRIFG